MSDGSASVNVTQAHSFVSEMSDHSTVIVNIKESLAAQFTAIDELFIRDTVYKADNSATPLLKDVFAAWTAWKNEYLTQLGNLATACRTWAEDIHNHVTGTVISDQGNASNVTTTH